MGFSFDDLPDVAIARDLLRRWWGLELGLAEASGAGYARASHPVCETVRGAAPAACAAALTEIAAGFAERQREPVVRTCHAGLILVAAPVYGAHGLLGVVYASGARPAARSLDAVAEGLAAIGSPDEARAMAASVPALDDADLARVRDLVRSAANPAAMSVSALAQAAGAAPRTVSQTTCDARA